MAQKNSWKETCWGGREGGHWCFVNRTHVRIMNQRKGSLGGTVYCMHSVPHGLLHYLMALFTTPWPCSLPHGLAHYPMALFTTHMTLFTNHIGNLRSLNCSSCPPQGVVGDKRREPGMCSQLPRQRWNWLKPEFLLRTIQADLCFISPSFLEVR